MVLWKEIYWKPWEWNKDDWSGWSLLQRLTQILWGYPEDFCCGRIPRKWLGQPHHHWRHAEERQDWPYLSLGNSLEKESHRAGIRPASCALTLRNRGGKKMVVRKNRGVLRIQIGGDKGRRSIVKCSTSVMTVLLCVSLSFGVSLSLSNKRGVYASE